MPPALLPRRPDDTHRLMIVGQNGTGKTVGGVYSLAFRSYDVMPWILVNYKEDEYMNDIPGVRELGPNEAIPRDPGLYMVRPFPAAHSMDAMLLKAYQRGNVGFYIDETHDIGQRSMAFQRLLKQGRSKRIPLIMLTQRPVWLSKEAFTEANFFQIYPLIDPGDRKRMCEWTKGLELNYDETLAEYESYYFDAGKRRLAKLGPAPFGDDVLNIFDRRRPKRLRKA